MRSARGQLPVFLGQPVNPAGLLLDPELKLIPLTEVDGSLFGLLALAHEQLLLPLLAVDTLVLVVLGHPEQLGVLLLEPLVAAPQGPGLLPQLLALPLQAAQPVQQLLLTTAQQLPLFPAGLQLVPVHLLGLVLLCPEVVQLALEQAAFVPDLGQGRPLLLYLLLMADVPLGQI